MIVHGASLPGGEPPGQDRWASTEHGVIVLDGATAFDPEAPPAGRYGDELLDALKSCLDSDADLPYVLRHAISVVTYRLSLEPGTAPSSTVLLLREDRDRIEVAVLGDSTAMIGFHNGRTERLTDDRIEHIAAQEREQCRAHLARRSGYNSTHRELLTKIQHAERQARNREDGYYIAEADATAAHHAILRSFPRDEVAWCVLATDGVQRGLDHHGIDWITLYQDSDAELAHRLDELQRWEAEQDPDGAHLPRAKRHDDKTLVTWINT
ncbi:PP2C family serine/threonine-protein phosphatase [Pseudonocardia sp. H11422]|uniref:PP2C family serine/threonine-protein phosphatase n=1 Tax=Pseudonocardia sp. H11422 TaxID=2835866 RepID=UPI001BDD4600|nr:PP2C family serine/threonine-protein phosphatase [Pseudonocardia sp. H11422]